MSGAGDYLGPTRPGRFFSNPYSAWHIRALPKTAYYMDFDGAEIVEGEAAIVYEIKTIPGDLYSAICRNDSSDALNDDFWSRVNIWQLQPLLRHANQAAGFALLLFTPVNAESFGVFDVRNVVEQDFFTDAVPRIDLRANFIPQAQWARHVLRMRESFRSWRRSSEEVSACHISFSGPRLRLREQDGPNRWRWGRGTSDNGPSDPGRWIER